ncbi:MAG: pentapeptide repeat-containing protein [Ilumatobacteraceae bacterium]
MATTASTSAPAVSSTAPPATTAATVAATTTTAAPITVLPAGMQFTAPGVAIPAIPAGAELHADLPAAAVIDGDTWAFASTMTNGQRVCTKSAVVCAEMQLDPVLFAGTPSTGLQPVPVDDITTLPTPSDAPIAEAIQPSALVHSKLGWVMVGQADFTDLRVSQLATRAFRALIWFSADGSTWQRIDVRDIVGDQEAVLESVVASDSGFVAVGTIGGSDDLKSPSQGLVLRSSDGITWTATKLPTTYSDQLHQVTVFGSTIVVRGLEYICSSDSFGLIVRGFGGQERWWKSDDGAATFTAVDPAASGVETKGAVAPADPSGCAGADVNTFATQAGSMQVVGSRLFLLSPDSTTVASTTDLGSWTTSKLPGVSGIGFDSVHGDGAGGFAIVRVQGPTVGGRPLQFGVQSVGWSSDSAAATWTPLPAVAPTASPNPAPQFSTADGRVVMFEQITAADGSLTDEAFVSAAAPYVAPVACSFQPASKCPFETIDGADLSGKDLSGIDLTGATITDTNFSGANLTGAVLGSAVISGGTFTGTKLASADLRSADIRKANLSGADLSGANLTRANASLSLFAGVNLTNAVVAVTVDLTIPAPPGLSFAGLNLDHASFTNLAATLIDLHGTDWSGAVLTATSFSGVDLTGANFTGADLQTTSFLQHVTLTGAVTTGANIGSPSGSAAEWTELGTTDVICPDGQGPTPAAGLEYNLCRFAI